MARALELAGKGRGWTSPNPMVGAVVVRKGRVVGEGYHRRAGEAHAEANALKEAGGESRGADLYVNLEPCSHYGRTPPCVSAIIESGVRKVFMAVRDPDPRVDGRGISRLEEHGVEVEIGLMGREARRLNEYYFKYRETGRPFVVLKAALSLDGKMATRGGDSRWITSEAARRVVHEMRSGVDAVMVGVGTLLLDDPLLNVRMTGRKGPHPRRIIVDSQLRTSPSSRLFRETPEIETLVATTEKSSPEAAVDLEEAGGRILRIPGSGDRVDLGRLMAELASRNVTSVMLEGGARLFTAILEEDLADKVVVFIAPVIIGGEGALSPFLGEGAGTLKDARRLKEVTVKVLGDNVMVQGYLGET